MVYFLTISQEKNTVNFSRRGAPKKAGAETTLKEEDINFSGNKEGFFSLMSNDLIEHVMKAQLYVCWHSIVT